jgi:peptidoglycan hydrolase CwlO-like protein
LARLQADLAGTEQRTEVWTGRMATQSNEIRRLLTEYESERRTTEPLRRQIETMLTQEIRLQAQLANQGKELQSLRDQAQKQQDAMDALRKANQTLEVEKQGLTSNNQEQAKLIDALRKETGEAAKRLQTQITKTQSPETTAPSNAPPANAKPRASPGSVDAH